MIGWANRITTLEPTKIKSKQVKMVCKITHYKLYIKFICP